MSICRDGRERQFVPPSVIDAIGRVRQLEEGLNISKELQEHRSLVAALTMYAEFVREIERYAAFGNTSEDLYQSAFFEFLCSELKLADFCQMCSLIDERVRPAVICNGLFDRFAPGMFKEAVDSLDDKTPSAYIADLAAITRQNVRAMLPAVISPAIHFAATMYARGHVEDLTLLSELCLSRKITYQELQSATKALQDCFFSPSEQDASVMLRLGAMVAESLPEITQWYLQPEPSNNPYILFGFYSSLINKIASGLPSEDVIDQVGGLLDRLAPLHRYLDGKVVEPFMHSLQGVVADSIIRHPSDLADCYAEKAAFLFEASWGPEIAMIWAIGSRKNGLTNKSRAAVILRACLKSSKVTSELGKVLRRKLQKSDPGEVKEFYETIGVVLRSIRRSCIDTPVVDNALSLLGEGGMLPSIAIREVLLLLGVPSLGGKRLGAVALPWVSRKHARPAVLNRARDVVDVIRGQLGASVRWRLGID